MKPSLPADEYRRLAMVFVLDSALHLRTFLTVTQLQHIPGGPRRGITYTKHSERNRPARFSHVICSKSPQQQLLVDLRPCISHVYTPE